MIGPLQADGILLVDDHPLMRDGLRAALRAMMPGVRIDDAGSGAEALEKASANRPGLVLLDIQLPDMTGVELARKLKGQIPGASLLMVAGEADPWTIRESLEAGASGFMSKVNSLSCLAAAIQTVLGGKEFLCPESQAALRDAGRRSVPADGELPGPEALSDREREVLRLLASGRNTKEIASDLGISPKTVETHRQHIFRKLGTSSIAVVTRYALRHGMIRH